MTAIVMAGSLELEDGIMIEHFKRLFEHARWADERTLRSIVESEHLPAHALELFAHVLAAEQVWLNRMCDAPSRISIWPSLSVAECDALVAENGSAYSAFLAELEPAGLTRSVRYRNSAGNEFESTVEEMLTQVAMHGSYHRGQIAALVRAAGDTPQPTDYIAFTRGAPAATRPAS